VASVNRFTRKLPGNFTMADPAMRFCARLLTCWKTSKDAAKTEDRRVMSNSDHLFWVNRATMNGGDGHFRSLFQVL